MCDVSVMEIIGRVGKVYVSVIIRVGCFKYEISGTRWMQGLEPLQNLDEVIKTNLRHRRAVGNHDFRLEGALQGRAD